ncbi:MAG: ketoacyl-ACP synthase III, partial [Thermoguttaceae bacterium]
LPTSCAAFDFNLGCSGYVYGLALVKSMLESGQASKALLITGETYTKWMHPDDFSTRAIFGDAGTATLVEARERERAPIGPFVYGTDGRGKDNLIVPGSGARECALDAAEDRRLDHHRPRALFMDGPEIFSFTMRVVPTAVRSLLTKAELSWDAVDWVVFHQANRFMLEHLRKQCRIPTEKFVYCLEDYGNTVSNTIPITLADMVNDGRLRRGHRVMLVGFGVGYSWSACILHWC